MVALFPVVFYLPKFFEYRYAEVVQVVAREVNCSAYAGAADSAEVSEAIRVD